MNTEQGQTGELPPRYDQHHLVRNLTALARVDSALAERLCLPVRSDHVTFGPDGDAALLHNQFPIKLGLTASAVQALLDAAPPRAAPHPSPRDAPIGSLLILGAGLGELVKGALDRDLEGNVIAWERDPWLLRLMLMANDYSFELSCGRLRLLLGTDLVSEPPHPSLEHPALRHVYRHEISPYPTNGPDDAPRGDRWVLVGTGGLFVEELIGTLRGLGFTAWTVDVAGLAHEELAHAVNTLHPRAIVVINYTEGLAEFSRQRGVPVLCWEIDPSTAQPKTTSVDTSHVHLFLHRKRNVPGFKRSGFTRVSYLPLAADPELRRPVQRVGPVANRYRAAVCFVGTSMQANAERLVARFVSAYGQCFSGRRTAATEARDLATSVIDAQEHAEDLASLEAEFERQAPGLLPRLRDGLDGEDPIIWLSETVSCRRRSRYVSALAKHQMQVWGDTGWERLGAAGVDYRGPAKHREELTCIYNATDINIDIGRISQRDITTMRVFDILACRSFVIAEHSDSLEELFEVGVEVECHRSLPELLDKVAYYRRHPDSAARIAERGYRAVLSRHTIEHRLRAMLAEARIVLAPARQEDVPGPKRWRA